MPDNIIIDYTYQELNEKYQYIIMSHLLECFKVKEQNLAKMSKAATTSGSPDNAATTKENHSNPTPFWVNKG